MKVGNIEINPKLFQTDCPVYSSISSILLDLLSTKFNTAEAMYLVVSCASTSIIQATAELSELFVTEDFRKMYSLDIPHRKIMPQEILALPMFSNLNNPNNPHNDQKGEQ